MSVDYSSKDYWLKGWWVERYCMDVWEPVSMRWDTMEKALEVLDQHMSTPSAITYRIANYDQGVYLIIPKKV